MSKVSQFTAGVVNAIIATIPSGQTKSDIVDTLGTTFVQIEMPAELDGDFFTFETSSDKLTFQEYRNIDNIQVSISPAQAGVNYGWAAMDFFPSRYFKIVSNATETADRVFRLIPKPI